MTTNHLIKTDLGEKEEQNKIATTHAPHLRRAYENNPANTKSQNKLQMRLREYMRVGDGE